MSAIVYNIVINTPTRKVSNEKGNAIEYRDNPVKTTRNIEEAKDIARAQRLKEEEYAYVIQSRGHAERTVFARNNKKEWSYF